jgi:hypothetical protein
MRYGPLKISVFDEVNGPLSSPFTSDTLLLQVHFNRTWNVNRNLLAQNISIKCWCESKKKNWRHFIPVKAKLVKALSNPLQHQTQTRVLLKDKKITLVSWMYFYCIVVFNMFRHSCGHLQGGEKKNIYIFFKILYFWSKFNRWIFNQNYMIFKLRSHLDTF